MANSSQRRRAQHARRRREEQLTIAALAGDEPTNVTGKSCSHVGRLVSGCQSCKEFRERLGRNPYIIPY
jgi:hypothetical protein